MNQVRTISLRQLPREIQTVSVKCGDSVIRLGCNIEDIFNSYTENISQDIVNCPPDAEVYYVTPSLCPKFLNAEDDFTVDVIRNRLLYAGKEHYGKMKSLISAMGSTCRSSRFRQGIHSCAFSIGNRGKLLLGDACSGKTFIFLNLLKYCDSVVTDDWCDIILENDGSVSALCLEKNISINCSDIANFVNLKLLPESTLDLPSIPHGFRDKIVFPLTLLDKCVNNQITINDIYYLNTDNGFSLSSTPNSEEMNLAFAHISKHLPICYLLDNNFTPENAATINQKKKTLKMYRDRQKFFQALTDRIDKGFINFHAIPYKKNVQMLNSVVDFIRRS